MKTIITVKTNPKIKKDASTLAAKYGLSLSDIVNISLAQFVNSGELVVSDKWKMSPALEKAISQAEAELQSGKTSPVFDNAKDAAKWLEI